MPMLQGNTSYEYYIWQGLGPILGHNLDQKVAKMVISRSLFQFCRLRVKHIK